MLMALGAVTAKAQHALEPGKPYAAYCNIVGYNFWGYGKVKIRLDFGGNWKMDYSLFDENNKKIKFNSMMEVLGYMGKRGWTVKGTYYITEAKGQHVVHYLLEKTVTDDSQITEGMIVHKDESNKKDMEDIMGAFQ